MKGYKIYYNEKTKRFENETELSEVSNDKYNVDTDISWIEGLKNAENSVITLNNKLQDGKIVVKKCRDCDRFFCVDKEELNWLEEKGLKPYSRCYNCRSARKNKK